MIAQNYDAYTSEDFKVWQTLFDRQISLLRAVACNEFLEAVETVKFKSDEIPRFEDLNKILAKTSGWKLKVVPNIVPNSEFFPLLADQTFTATSWLRKMSQLDYLEEPDMFHDVFGHVPLLSNPTFCAFFKGLALIAMQNLHNPMALEMLGRIYWFTIEFGLIKEEGRTKIYGAGIISSHGETQFSLSDTPKHLSFDVATILDTPYDNMRIQDTYFIIENFEQLFDSLPEIDSCLKHRLKKVS